MTRQGHGGDVDGVPPDETAHEPLERLANGLSVPVKPLTERRTGAA